MASRKKQSRKKTNKKSSTRKSQTNRRAKAKYAALDPRLNLKIRHELLDYDYLNKLSEPEKEWLNKFTEEYVHASLNTKNPKKNLHKNKKLRIDCYNRNNSRNRDMLTRGKVTNKLDGIDRLNNIGYDEEKRIHSAIDAKIETKNLTILKKKK